MRSVHERVATIAAATARDRALIAARRGEVMEQGDQLAALLDLARALTDANIPYALIGGIAVGVHADFPRATNDVDVAVTTARRPQVVEALTRPGFVVTGEFEHSINFRHASGEPVQVSFDDVFDSMIGRAETVEIGGTPIRIVTKEDLIASKALQDQVDIELLRGDVPGPDEGW
jgi:predicted nucleotidyltransferase